ncbi:MAG: SURF1 family protein [Pseudomonadota bacterium]
MATKTKSRNRFPWLVIALAIPALLVLLALGTWQVQRLAWKEGLIATVEARMNTAPLPALEAVHSEDTVGGLDYRPVSISGTYKPGEVFFEFTTYNGVSGWNLFHLLEPPPNEQRRARYTIVNRGFIAYDMREQWEDVASLPEGEVELTGLLRMGLVEKPGFALPDNDEAQRTFYWRSMQGMARAAGVDAGQVTDWYIDEGMPGEGQLGEWPVRGTTIVQFSNNHLQYAVTWYGLALTLVGVVGFFVAGRLRDGDDAANST